MISFYDMFWMTAKKTKDEDDTDDTSEKVEE